MKLYEYVIKIRDKASPALNRMKEIAGKNSNAMDQVRRAAAGMGSGIERAAKRGSAAIGRMRDKIQHNASRIKASLRDAANEIPGLDRAMRLATNPALALGAAAAALGLGLNKARKEATLFNKEFLQIRNLNLDKSAAQLDSYRRSLLGLSFQEGLDAKQVSKAAYDVQSGTGLFGAATEQFVAKVGRFSKTVQTDLNEQINSTIKAMKAYGLGISDIDGLLESNTKTVQVGITTFAELAREQNEYIGVAASVGQGIDTANKTFAAFTAISKDARIAATLTKYAFEGLTQEKTIEGLQSIGVSLFDQTGHLRKLDDVIRELVPKFQEMSDQDFAQLRNDIGGPEGLRMLFNQLRIAGDDVIATFDKYDQSAFDLAKATAQAQQDSSILYDTFKNKLNVVLIELGEMTLPAVNRVMGDFVDKLKDVRDNYSSFRDLVTGEKSPWAFIQEEVKDTGKQIFGFFDSIVQGYQLMKTGFASGDFSAFKAGMKVFMTGMPEEIKKKSGLSQARGINDFAPGASKTQEQLMGDFYKSHANQFEGMKRKELEAKLLAKGIEFSPGLGLGQLELMLRKALMGKPDIPGGDGGTTVDELKKKGSMSSPFKFDTMDALAEIMQSSAKDAPEREESRRGIHAITGGGKNVTNITIQEVKFADTYEAHYATIQEGAEDFRDKFQEELSRVLNDFNQIGAQ